MEVWKSIESYNGDYEVSNLGRVKSLKFSKEKILKGGVNSSGYLLVNLSRGSLRKNVYVHKLVALQFIKDNTYNKTLVIDHIDNDKLNNKLYNLQIITIRQNLSKDKKNKTSKYTGVSFYKSTKKWRASIGINSKNKNLGYFKCEISASLAYQKALINLKIEQKNIITQV